MVERRIAEAAAAMRGQVIQGDPRAVWRGAALDSRKVAGGELFFALQGRQTDGHRFVREAVERGAAGAVVHAAAEAPPEAALVRVSDTYGALHDLARHVRSQVPGRLAAVTGSVGKTTTKELLAAMLGRRFRVACSPGNLNNLYGFPLALLGIPDDTEWMVAELGMSEPGELAELGRLARPDAALFLNVRPVHLEFFGSLRDIAEAKAELLEGLAPGGLVVANADDPEVSRIARRHPGRIVWYGIDAAAEVRAAELEPAPAGGSRFRLVAGEGSQPVELPLLGRYNVENCLAAAACAWALGVGLGDIAAAAAVAQPPSMRGVVHPLAAGGRLIDDSYNSNPEALRQALAAAAGLPAGRRWAVLGEMLELGAAASRFHRRGGEEAARYGFSPIFGVGNLARELVAGAAAAGADGRWFSSAAAAAEAASKELRPGDLLLVKGSRGVGLEAVVRRILGEEGDV